MVAIGEAPFCRAGVDYEDQPEGNVPVALTPPARSGGEAPILATANMIDPSLPEPPPNVWRQHPQRLSAKTHLQEAKS